VAERQPPRQPGGAEGEQAGPGQHRTRIATAGGRDGPGQQRAAERDALAAEPPAGGDPAEQLARNQYLPE
jgi:hypothetical protein